jgi:hypothetical protein
LNFNFGFNLIRNLQIVFGTHPLSLYCSRDEFPGNHPIAIQLDPDTMIANALSFFAFEISAPRRARCGNRPTAMEGRTVLILDRAYSEKPSRYWIRAVVDF